MMGHTNKATINQRRPLTQGLRDLLAILVHKAQRKERLAEHYLDRKDKSMMRALLDRGYATWHIETRSYSATEVGITALSSTDNCQGDK